MIMNFSDMNIVIAGGNTGIGLQLATDLVKAHGNVYMLSRTVPPDDLLKQVRHQAVDFSSGLEAQGVALPDQIHGLVYTPGTINLKPFNRLTDEQFLSDYEINFLGAVRLLRISLSGLVKARGSSVVLFSTVAVGTGMPYHASIASAKGAVEGLTRSLAAEWTNRKIRVNALAPDLTDTPLASDLLSTPDKRERAANRHPLKRIGTPDDLSSAAQYLLSNSSGWVTGQILSIDGGMSSIRDS